MRYFWGERTGKLDISRISVHDVCLAEREKNNNNSKPQPEEWIVKASIEKWRRLFLTDSRVFFFSSIRCWHWCSSCFYAHWASMSRNWWAMVYFWCVRMTFGSYKSIRSIRTKTLVCVTRTKISNCESIKFSYGNLEIDLPTSKKSIIYISTRFSTENVLSAFGMETPHKNYFAYFWLKFRNCQCASEHWLSDCLVFFRFMLCWVEPITQSTVEELSLMLI